MVSQSMMRSRRVLLVLLSRAKTHTPPDLIESTEKTENAKRGQQSKGEDEGEGEGEGEVDSQKTRGRFVGLANSVKTASL